MSDNKENGADKQPQVPLVVNGQYIKDLSFEAPNSPGVLTELQGQQPTINVNVNVSTALVENGPIAGNVHEVVLDLQAEMKLGEKVGFLVELKYAGVFTLNIAQEHVNPVLLIECPRLLFPFARQILSDVTQGGGFMPLSLQPIDFATMYQARAKEDLAALDAEVADMAAKQDKLKN